MSPQKHLIESFNYDLWANLRWLEFLPQATLEEVAVFVHILNAQKIWADRVGGNSPTEFPNIEPIAENIRFLNQVWLNLLEEYGIDEVIDYKRTTGEPQSLEFSQIIRQVTNHGTYHRGHLRGLCQARNCTDFPETDILHYYWSL